MGKKAQINHFEENMGIIPLHFNVVEHHLPLQDFISAARNTEAIIENFNQEFFGGELKYELLILPPKPGTFLEVLGLTISTLGATWAFLHSEVGKAYVKGLTGHEPVFWAEQAGKKHAESLKKRKDEITKNPEISSSEIPTDLVDHHATSLIIVNMTVGFFEKNTQELRKVGIDKNKFRLAYKARNDFYQSCMNNRKILGVGFNEASAFPIKRVDFPKFIVEIPAEPETEDDENIQWKIETQDIKVNSPNWKKEGRKWQAECADDKEIWFSIEDENFWHHVKVKSIDPDINDNMTVQWAFPANKNRRNVKVLRVLSYNGKQLARPMLPEEFDEILENFSIDEPEQRELFHEH